MTYLGILGAGLCIVAYFMIEREIISSQNWPYYLMNGLGGLFVLIAVIFSYDGGDLGAIIQEACWVIISLMGLRKIHKANFTRKQGEKDV